MSTEARREWFRAHVHVQEVNRRRKRNRKEMESETDTTESPRRMKTFQWYLPMGDKNAKVCKGLFLASLGFNPGNDTSVRSAVEQSATSAVAPKDKRRTGMATNKCDQDAIKSHILSYAPAAPHYRYMHSPKRRYLPPDLSIRKMHQDFTETHGKKCSLESYRKIVKELNIGFTNLRRKNVKRVSCTSCIRTAVRPSDRRVANATCVHHTKSTSKRPTKLEASTTVMRKESGRTMNFC